MNKITLNYSFIIFFLMVFTSCKTVPEPFEELNNPVKLNPDYSEITIPANIAPLNFSILEKGEAYFIRVKGKNGAPIEVSSKDGIVKIPLKKWKKLLESNISERLEYEVFVKNDASWKKYPTFKNFVSGYKVDPFLYYRLLYPGYESWAEISIVQRSMESFDEKVVIENNAVEQNCVNCHAFNQQNPANFMFHMRGSMGGTYIITDDDLQKFNLKTSEMENSAVYPRWHPSGKFVAFSSNKVVQQFHAVESKKIEVSDLNSSLVLYDVEKNEMMQIPVDTKKEFMDTYPEWSPDGKTLFFCRASQIKENYDYRETRYNLCRVDFNPETRKFGETEVIFDASAQGISVSFPRVSPNGKILVFTCHNFGVFSIWHKEADLYSINLNNLEVEKMDEINSDFTESYHSWASNGRWLIFSSKRDDGLTARPYISFVNENGKTQKPFLLPQKDPTFYTTFLKTFNIPEFARAEISFSPGEIRDAAEQGAIQAKWSDNP